MESYGKQTFHFTEDIFIAVRHFYYSSPKLGEEKNLIPQIKFLCLKSY